MVSELWTIYMRTLPLTFKKIVYYLFYILIYVSIFYLFNFHNYDIDYNTIIYDNFCENKMLLLFPKF